MKLRPFELGLVIFFGVLIIVAMILFATYKPSKTSEGGLSPIVGRVDIWGTLPSEGVNLLLEKLSKDSESYDSVRYKYFPQESFDEALVNALADGAGPDLILTSHEKLVEMQKRILPVSYNSFPIRNIRDSYIDGAQIFALSDGMYAYPLAADPLMLYWNKDILTSEGFLEPPKTWEEFVNNIFPALIERDFNRNIQRSVVAMGEYSNVRNSFGIISALLLQGGSNTVTESGGRYSVLIKSPSKGGTDPFSSAVDFYTRFSKPSNALYSWNRSFGEDRSEFTSGKVVFYFGYASEAAFIERINPNLNFDIAEIPQGANATVRRTYGKFYGVSLLKSSKNLNSAKNVMLAFAKSENSGFLASKSNMAPPHRSLVSAGSNDVYGRFTYKSAAIAYGWLNPDIESTDSVFETMTKDINENRSSVSEATSDAVNKITSNY